MSSARPALLRRRRADFYFRFRFRDRRRRRSAEAGGSRRSRECSRCCGRWSGTRSPWIRQGWWWWTVSGGCRKWRRWSSPPDPTTSSVLCARNLQCQTLASGHDSRGYNHCKLLRCYDRPNYCKKVQVAHTRLPGVGFRSWPRFLAVSLQVTWVINPAVGCHYFPPGLQLPSQPLRGLLPVLLIEQRHDGCEQFA